MDSRTKVEQGLEFKGKQDRTLTIKTDDFHHSGVISVFPDICTNQNRWYKAF